MNRFNPCHTQQRALRDTLHFPDVGIIGLVPEVWGGPWMPRHHVLTRLTEYFNIVWVNPGYGSYVIWLQGSSKHKGIDFYHPKPKNLVVYYPEKWLPTLYWPGFLASFLSRRRLGRVRKRLLKMGCKKIVVYLWRPQFKENLDHVAHNVSCYHIDDEYTFSFIEKPLDHYEAELILHVDQVFIHSPALLEKKGGLNPNTLFVTNGVDYNAFSTPCDEPPDMKTIPRPRIGYIGILKKQLDFSLVKELVERHPEWSFVFVGPKGNLGDDAVLLQQISQRKNVYLLGERSIKALPSYVQRMDVNTLCYKVNDYTKFIYPMKLNEYLATGRPVVAPPLPALLDLENVIRIARTADEWSQAISESLTSTACNPEKVQQRRDVALDHDWNTIVRVIAKSICQRLGPSYLKRFEDLAIRKS